MFWTRYNFIFIIIYHMYEETKKFVYLVYELG